MIKSFIFHYGAVKHSKKKKKSLKKCDSLDVFRKKTETGCIVGQLADMYKITFLRLGRCLKKSTLIVSFSKSSIYS